MEQIHWSQDYFIGEEQIDAQHKTLVGLINYLIKFQSNSDPILMKRVFTTLVQYTEQHFTYEEKILERIQYPDLREHRAQHQNFVKELESFQTRYNKHQANINNQLLKFLKGWLTSHILVHDVEYKRYLERLKSL